MVSTQNATNDTAGILRTATTLVDGRSATAPTAKQFLRATAGTTMDWENIDVPVNLQSGTTYSFVDGDRSKLVSFTNAGAMTGTLANPTTLATGAGWFVYVENRGAGTLSLTTVAGNIDGSASLSIGPNLGILVASDGTNYFTMRGMGSSSTPALSSVFPWTDVTGTSATMAVDNGYVADNAGLCTLTLPVTAAFGTSIAIAGKGAGGWTMAQPAGVTTKFGNATTTAGTGGSIASTNANDALLLLCTTAASAGVGVWSVRSAQGNLTVT